MHPGDGLNKCLAVVESCTTNAQVWTANRYFNLFFKSLPISDNFDHRVMFNEARNKVLSKIWRRERETK